MKKNVVGLIGIVIVMSLSACSNKPEASEGVTQNVQTEQEAAEVEQETETMADDLPKQQESSMQVEHIDEEMTPEDMSAEEAETDLILEKLVGEYEYVSDYGKGSLTIKKAEQGYSIDDYESETSYRFLAYSSDIKYIENNRIYIKYPDKVYSDDTVVFCDYILEYGSDEIKVHYKKFENDDEQFLYCATKKKLENQGENDNSEKPSEELLDLFINGSIDAIDSTDMTSTFNITDFSMNSEEWDSYSIGERVDLDNDGENEQIICGPYGGIYLDARDNKVYEFAMGDGNANVLSYTYYNGYIWILYSNSMNAGYEAYHMVKFEGADNIFAEINFGEELVDENNQESGIKFLFNGEEISYDEYSAFCSKIFAAEVSTN